MKQKFNHTGGGTGCIEGMGNGGSHIRPRVYVPPLIIFDRKPDGDGKPTKAKHSRPKIARPVVIV